MIDAVERDRGMVPVGRDSRFAWALHGVLPQAATDRLARWGAR